MLYAGVDHHTKTSHFTICDSAGNVLKRKNLPSSKTAIAGVLSQFDDEIKVVLEAGYNWGRMYDWLDELADEVVLAHPMKVRAIAEAKRKNDRIDSETLAHLLRADLIPEAYACSREMRAIKRVLRRRMFLVKLRTMLKNRIHSTLSQHDIEKPRVTDLFGHEGRTWLETIELPKPDNELLSGDLSLLDKVVRHIDDTEDLIERLSKHDQVVSRLRSIPGIGTFFSVLIRYEVGDMSRFPAPEKFASYTGLVPSTYASGSKVHHGRLTKQGNKSLRWALVEAVTGAIRVSPQLRAFYERLKKRKGVKEAQVATARKLAEIVWHVWTEERFHEIR
jgi:transposase